MVNFKRDKKPKRPMCAYMLWLNSIRDDIKSAYPGLSMPQIVKKAGEIWRGTEDKTEWENKAAQAREQYKKEMSEFKKAGAGRNKKKSALKFRKLEICIEDSDSDDGVDYSKLP